MNSPDQIEHEAAHWVVRLERGLTAPEQDEFLDWLTTDPRHGEELNAQKAGWNRLDHLADWRPEHGPVPNRDVLAPALRGSWLRRGRRVALLAGSLAAAAAVAFFLLTRTSAPADPVAPLAAPIALIEQRTLEDGSIVSLNRGAEVAVRYTAGERRVELVRGEAHFAVAKNPDRPFTVSAQGVDVRAVGTEFDVRLNPSAVEVVVTEGRVRVRAPESAGMPPDELPLVEAGHSTIVPLAAPVAPGITELRPDEMAARLAWQPRLLEFNEAPLPAIVAEFNRCNAPIRLQLADPELEGRILNASIRSDNIEGFVRLLEGGFGVQAQRSGDVITLRLARRR